MAQIDLVALQQRLAQKQPKPVPAEPPSWSIRPASTLRTAPAPKARPAAASAAAPAGTLRATTTMRAALPLEATNARTARAQERARAAALRTLRAFVQNHVTRFDDGRNDPGQDGQSGLSAALHWGLLFAGEDVTVRPPLRLGATS